ncbi:MAG: hypothetical protein H0S82_02825 [Anaerolineaceae bacterium]|nr:hypothetical protein [Anaerolineaceae bacterium]
MTAFLLAVSAFERIGFIERTVEMAVDEKAGNALDLLTAWELMAINVLLAIEPRADFDVNAVQANMLSLIEALDADKLDPALADKGFMQKTEELVLALLHGDPIDVVNPAVFEARQAVIAAAQVIYNQAAARGVWPIHPEIRAAVGDGK